MSTKLIALLIILTISRTNAPDPGIADRGTLHRIPRAFAHVILSGLSTLIRSLPYGPVPPQSIEDTVLVDNQQCLVRISLYNSVCDVSQDNGDSLPRAAVVEGLRAVMATLATDLFDNAASYVTVIQGRFAMEYMLQDTQDELMNDHTRKDDVRPWLMAWSCFPYVNMIQSGPKAHRFSTIRPGSYISSLNGLYALELGNACDLKLKERASSNVVWGPWITDHANCYLAVQLDGNVVLENEDVCVWATNTMDTSSGLVSLVLVMQNDRNLVLYRNSGSLRAIWASDTEI